MTGGRLLFVIVGLATMAAGTAALVRPSLIRTLIGLPDAEAAAYVLRIGGMMVATFGLVLVLFVIVFATAPGAAG